MIPGDLVILGLVLAAIVWFTRRALSRVRINRICAWCGCIMGTKWANSPGDTHGICKYCSGRMEKQIEGHFGNN